MPDIIEGMDNLLKKLDEIEDLLKKDPQLMPAVKSPTLGSGMGISMPKPASPKISGIAPSSKKDPAKVAQQLKNPKIEIKPLIKYADNGQWSIDTED